MHFLFTGQFIHLLSAVTFQFYMDTVLAWVPNSVPLWVQSKLRNKERENESHSQGNNKPKAATSVIKLFNTQHNTCYNICNEKCKGWQVCHV